MRDKGWVEAEKLVAGDEVFTSRGGWLKVAGGTWLQGTRTVYNLEVDGFHTYFVGESGAWVHNRCKLKPDADAVGAHTVFNRNPQTGRITKYETFRPQTNPRNPNPWESAKRFDGMGDGYFNKVTKEVVPNPHVHDPTAPGSVRPPEAWEKPLGY